MLPEGFITKDIYNPEISVVVMLSKAKSLIAKDGGCDNECGGGCPLAWESLKRGIKSRCNMLSLMPSIKIKSEDKGIKFRDNFRYLKYLACKQFIDIFEPSKKYTKLDLTE